MSLPVTMHADDRAPTARETLTATVESVTRAFRRGVLMAGTVSFFAAILTLTVPVYMLQVFERVIGSRSIETLAMLTLIALVAIACHAALGFLKNTILSRVGYWIEARLSLALLEESMRRAAHLTARSSLKPLRQASQLRDYVAGGTLASAIELLWAPLFLLFLFFAHYAFGLIAVAGAIGHVLLSWWSEAATRQSGDQARALGKDAYRLADSGLDGANALAPIGMKGNVLDRWTGLQGGALEAQAEEARRGSIVTTASKLLSNGMQIAVIATGAMLIIAQAISPGVMIAAAIIVRRAVSPFERARSIWRATIRMRKAIEGIQQLAKTQRLEQPPAIGRRIQPSLLVDRATVRYPQATARVFHRLALEIRPGETVCIAGGVGSGKSTLARLLVGAILPRSGRVLIGGFDTRQLDEDEIGSQIGYLPQDVAFCPGSIGQNIARLTKDAAAPMREAARLAGIEEMIARLPDGFDTDIDDPGAFMSTRLRRRIGLARALFGHPSLVVLDEPDPPASAEDVATWRRLFEHLRLRGATLVVFTNSVELMMLARRVMQLGDGRLEPAEEFSSATVARLIERGCAVVVAHPRLAEIATTRDRGPAPEPQREADPI